MSEKIKKIKVPVRIDFGGGTTDIKAFSSKYGGAVLNAAINKYVEGKIITSDKESKLEYHADIPTSSGLGTSGAMTLVWLALISKKDDKKELAEQVYNISKARGLGEADGKQDQYAAAFGGINFWEFKNGEVKRELLKLDKEIIKELENKLILVYEGSHSSIEANKEIINDFKGGKNVGAFKQIKRIAIDMKKALKNNDLDKFAELMNQETKYREKLSKKVIPKKTKQLIKKGMNNGAISAKVCGAGEGGSILFFGDKEKIKKKFDKTFEFKFDFKGLQYL